MTIKPFAIQGSELTLGGSNLFTVLADGSLQANADSNVTTVTSTLTSRPTWLTITPRSPDRETLDTHYGFDITGMWFTGNNEETFIEQPAYPIHTTNGFSADTKVIVEFDIDLVSGEEDWGVCVYPANGVPHWSWDPHPSRIAAMVDCSIDGDPYAQAEIQGLTSSNYGTDTSIFTKARFTYDPVAELTTLELLNADNEVTSRAQVPGRLARDQDYMIGFDGDWDDAGPGDKSYFTSLTITSGNTAAAKTTEFTVTGEVKLSNSVKGFVNMQGPWENGDDNIAFQSVAAHDGYAYMIGEASWAENNRIRIDKYSLTSGELVWARILGAGRNAEFDISWDGTYTLDNISISGQGYQVGQVIYIAGDQISGGSNPANLVTITVTEVNSTGDITTATIAGTPPDGTGSLTGLTEYNSDARGDPAAVKYDTVTDTLVVLTRHYTPLGDADDNYWDRALITRINPVTGDVVSTVTLSDEGDIRPFDVAVHPTTGDTAVVGEKFNEYRSFGTLTMLNKANGYFDILKSNLDEEHWPGNQLPGEYPSDFWISGTGIANKENIDDVNFYGQLTCTLREGSGTVTVDVVCDGAGPYTYGEVTIGAGGTNYRVGHKIKYLGTQIPGGTTPENDLILTVSSISLDGIGTITGATASGTAPSGGTITGLNAGTNYNVGSGLSLEYYVDTLTGAVSLDGYYTSGTNYVVDDVVTIAGTQFANGASPANNITVTILGVDGGGAVNSVSATGTAPTNTIRIFVNGVDFTAVGGAWTMKQDLAGEAFVWTADWHVPIGGASNDSFQSVVYSKDGASIYAVGSGQYEVSYQQSLVVKYDTSNGDIDWSKFLNTTDNNAYATGVATIGTSDIVVSGYEYVGNPINMWKQFVARMDDTGTVLWKKYYNNTWGNDIAENSDIQVDSDDNIYVTINYQADTPGFTYDGFHVTKLDQLGHVIWSRCVNAPNDSSYLGDWAGNRWSSLSDGQLVVAGYTYVTDDSYFSGLWASFPTDGFTYLGGEGAFVQQGAFRFSQGSIYTTEDLIPPDNSFTPNVQAPNITDTTNLKKYETRPPIDLFEQHLHQMTDPKYGGLVFGDGSRQTFATDKVPQIKADRGYTITAQDSGKHIYYKNNSGTVYIPVWDTSWDNNSINFPVGFTFTIINRTGFDCYVSLTDWMGPRGSIFGAGRSLDYHTWGIPDSGSGSMVTLILLEAGQDLGNGNYKEPVWMISGPSDIYIDD